MEVPKKRKTKNHTGEDPNEGTQNYSFMNSSCDHGPVTLGMNNVPATPQSDLLSPSLNHTGHVFIGHIGLPQRHVLSDISNLPQGTCNENVNDHHYMDTSISCTPKANKKQRKRRQVGSSEIIELATNLSKSFNQAQLHDSDHALCENEDEDEELGFDNSLGRLTNKRSSYLDEGDPTYECEFCGALLWSNERLKRTNNSDNPLFSICCGHGKIVVPLFAEPPTGMDQLFFNKETPASKNFLKNIRAYNNMFCFTSMGGRIDHSMNNRGGGPYSFILSGQNHHLIGSLLPPEGSSPVYSQLYIHDTENEIANRIAAVSRGSGSNGIDKEVVRTIKNCLDNNNDIVKQYRKASEIITTDNVTDVNIRLIRKQGPDSENRQYIMPSTSEVAALVVGDFDRSYYKRDIIVKKQSGKLQRIDELHVAYLPLQYPLIFHYGNNGYDPTTTHSAQSLARTKKQKILTPREYMAFRLMKRKSERSVLLHSKKLLQQFIVDGYAMVESERLEYIRKHQKELRVDLYSGLADAITRGETDPSHTGKRVILPSSFTGGARYMILNYQDAMAICAWAGYPDIFLTFTCNPSWPEIVRFCKEEGLSPSDRPEILSRMFYMKLERLMKILKEEKIFGNIKAEIYTIEFQKRGLPHAHIILWLVESDKPRTSSDVDKIISAEIPDINEDPELYELVRNYMIHGPCGRSKANAPCMKNGKCGKYFPKRFHERTTMDENGYPTYRRRNDGRTVERKGVTLDNRYVVPYNPRLLRLFQGHLNVEKTNQSRAIKYLFKYISKGHDRVIAGIYSNSNTTSERSFDEIAHYLNCRYISSCEGAWRILSFDIHHRSPSVERLSFHLPQQQPIYYSRKEDIPSLFHSQRVKESMFLAWMAQNVEDPFARRLTYSEFPNYYTFVKAKRIWKLRQRGFSVGRLAHATPSQGELYYLRLLLTKVRGPKNYEAIRTVNNVVYPTFKEACYALRLLDDDKEFIDAIREASLWATGVYLRKFFVSMLLSHMLTQPEMVWEQTKVLICEDLLRISHSDERYKDVIISDVDRQEYGLKEINKLLLRNGKSLTDFPSMPNLSGQDPIDTTNHLIMEELNYDKDHAKVECQRLLETMTVEQRLIFDEVMVAVNSKSGGFFFVHGFGGTGKTYIWNALTAGVRGNGCIILNVASSGIAATLLPSGRTAHSRFCIPIEINEDSVCGLTHNSPAANLIKASDLIIWDEAPMIRKFCVEAVDRTLKDIMIDNRVFGGKCIVMGGDFRQILPVIPKAGRPEIVEASLNTSYLWSKCKLRHLTRNMRLQSSLDPVEQESIRSFSEWLLKVGDGELGLPDDGIASIKIPSDLLIKGCDDPVKAIVNATYPNLVVRLLEHDYLTYRAILAPTNEMVDKLNEYTCSLLPGQYVEYNSSDSINRAEECNDSFEELYNTEFLNKINCAGMPHHVLKLKVGIPIMLLRNVDQAAGLCNGTRLRISQLGRNVIKAIALNGNSVGEEVLIHRMDMNPSETKLPFSMTRRQFPVIISFAMTINKSQGQSMENVGLYLPNPVFSHGQLYVALSRVKSYRGLKILILDDDKRSASTTINVVYKEVFQNVFQQI